jgi:hypothetical protein
MKTTVIDGQEVPVLDATSVETTYRHMKTGEIFKERKDWEAKGFKEEEMAQDVKLWQYLECKNPNKYNQE